MQFGSAGGRNTLLTGTGQEFVDMHLAVDTLSDEAGVEEIVSNPPNMGYRDGSYLADLKDKLPDPIDLKGNPEGTTFKATLDFDELWAVNRGLVVARNQGFMLARHLRAAGDSATSQRMHNNAERYDTLQAEIVPHVPERERR